MRIAIRKYLPSYLFFLFIQSVIIGNTFAQQEMQSSNFMINPFLFNPAYSSVDDNMDIKLGYRYQWVGLQGSPQTSYISFHTPINKSHFSRSSGGDFHNWHGVGAVAMHDRIGAFSNIKIKANYSYNLALTKGRGYGKNHQDGLRIALGVFVGWNHFTLDKDILAQKNTSGATNVSSSSTLNDPTYQSLNRYSSQPVMDIDIGGMLYYQETYYLGVSSSQVLQSNTQISEGSDLSRHFYVTGLLKLQLNESFYLIPSVITKMTSGAPLSYNFNTRLDWKDKVYIGVGYRSKDAITGMLGTQVSWGSQSNRTKDKYLLNVFYSYDYTINGLKNSIYQHRSSGAHEVTIALFLSPLYRERNAEDTW